MAMDVGDLEMLTTQEHWLWPPQQTCASHQLLAIKVVTSSARVEWLFLWSSPRWQWKPRPALLDPSRPPAHGLPGLPCCLGSQDGVQ
jgi:hypothetical protein